MLACLLLAMAVVPVTRVEGALSRPVAALLLRLAPAAPARADVPEAHVARAARSVARPSDAAERERRVPGATARGRAAPDQRYLYLLHGTLLC